MLKFSAFLRESRSSHRARLQQVRDVMTFLKAQGARGLVAKNDWPRFVAGGTGIYEREELDTLFAVYDAEERLWFEFFLYREKYFDARLKPSPSTESRSLSI